MRVQQIRWSLYPKGLKTKRMRKPQKMDEGSDSRSEMRMRMKTRIRS